MADFWASDPRDRIIAVLGQIIDGSTAPYEGARELWTEYFSPDPDAFAELVTFVNDATDYEELPDRRLEVAQHIVDESRALLQKWSADD